MMKTRRLVLSSLLACAAAVMGAAPIGLVHLANPLQGTESVHEFSHGNIYPAVTLSFPMNKWESYTQPAKDPFFCQYRKNKLRGIH